MSMLQGMPAGKSANDPSCKGLADTAVRPCPLKRGLPESITRASDPRGPAVSERVLMFASPKTGAARYGALQVETSIVDADPHRLVEMLYDGALDAIARARRELAAGRIAEKGEATSRAIRIIDEGLKAALDNRAGSVAANLNELYDYMERTLVMANLESSDKRYAEVAALLGGLRDAWRSIRSQAAGLKAA